MSEGNPPRPDDLHDLEPLEPAPLTPIPPPPAPSAAQRTAAPARGKGRELERAPLMLRKAASILIFASLLPWMREGGFDLMVIVAKVVVLAGGGILYYSVLARHGEPVPGPFAALAKTHNRALDILGWLVILAGVLPLIDGGTRGEVVGAAVEKGALAIGLAVFMQILDYEKGGKLNPALGLMIPLVGVGALGRLATLFKEFDALALLGCLGIVAAAGVAGRTLQVAMKEAKAHGEAKKQAAVEARKAARTQQRAARGTGEAGGASPEPKRGEGGGGGAPPGRRAPPARSSPAGGSSSRATDCPRRAWRRSSWSRTPWAWTACTCSCGSTSPCRPRRWTGRGPCSCAAPAASPPRT